MIRPLVSIVINNYNYGHFLGDAIDSALAQTYSNVEVVVVDDGSTDNSHTVIKHYGDRIIPIYKPNGGQASAFNAGFAASNGDIICFLDADDVYLPRKIETVVEQISNFQSMQWCFHPLQLVDINQKSIEPILGIRLPHKLDLRQHMAQGQLKGYFPFAIPPTSGLCFTRALLLQILPMPTANLKILADSYLQFAALGLASGVALENPLALQRLHGNNFYTANLQAQRLSAPVIVLTAWTLRDRFPILKRFANSLFAQGLGLFWKFGEIESSLKPLIDRYQEVLTPKNFSGLNSALPITTSSHAELVKTI